MDAFSVGLLVLAALCYMASWYLVNRRWQIKSEWARPLLMLLLGPFLAFFAMIVFVFLFWPPGAWLSF